MSSKFKCVVLQHELHKVQVEMWHLKLKRNANKLLHKNINVYPIYQVVLLYIMYLYVLSALFNRSIGVMFLFSSVQVVIYGES